MAKRRRLTPAQPGYLDSAPAPAANRAPFASSAPIAQVAGEASARAALSDLAAEMEAARARGLLVEEIPLEAIALDHLVRDRLVQDEEEMTALVDSLRARGQQTPIELTPLPAPVGGKTHGLVSGWRRVTALSRLWAETGDTRFARARALVIRPETAQDAYVAMVEENEIRVNLSHYERAHIVWRALHEGVYPDQRSALQGLFGAVARSKRSKIGSFVVLVEALNDALRYPAAISEKLGLALVKRIGEEPDFVARLKATLARETPADAAAEVLVLARSLETKPPRPESDIARDPIRKTRIGDGMLLSFDPNKGRIEIKGEGVDEALYLALQDWLRER